MKTTPYSWAAAIAAALSNPRLHHLDSRPRQLAVVVFALLLAGYVGSILIGGSRTYANTMAHDNLLLIDGAYRMLHGALPHLDFMSPLGVLNFAGPALFAGTDIMLAVARYSGAVAVIAILLGSYVAISRLNLPLALLFVLLIAVLTSAPSAIGYPPDHVSFAMVYNRQSYACLLMLLVLALPAAPVASRIASLCDSALISALLVFLLHTKITFLAVGLGFCAVMFVTTTHLRRPIIIAVAVLIACVIAVTLWQPKFYLAYARDLADASLSRADEGADNARQLRMRLSNSKAEWLLGLVVIWMMWCERTRIGNQKALRTVLLYGAIIGCAVPLILLNSQLECLMLTTALFMHAAMIFFAGWQQQRSPQSTFNYLAALTCAAVFALSFSITKASSLDRYKRFSKSAHYAFEVPPALANFIIDEQQLSALTFVRTHALTLTPAQLRDLFALIDSNQEIPQTDYAYSIAEGTRLLRAVIALEGEGCVANFDFVNPFNVLLNLPVCRDAYLWVQPHVNISSRHFAAPERVLAHTSYITVPKLPALRDSADLLQQIYGDYLHANYRIVAETDLWQIWQRNPATQTAATF